jgi:predicted RNA-binding protein YlxR (DUF448 family)
VSGSVYMPIRLCVGCGTRAPQAALLRFVSAPDGVLALVAHRLPPGRTGYLHRQAVCWERFASRGGPLRSLGRNVDKPRRLTFIQELKTAEQSAIMR